MSKNTHNQAKNEDGDKKLSKKVKKVVDKKG